MQDKIMSKAQELVFKQTLPQLDTLLKDSKSFSEATSLMERLIEVKAKLNSDEGLDYKEAHTLCHEEMRIILKLETLQNKLDVLGFRHGNIVFAVKHEVIDGKHNFVRVVDVLPE